MRKIDHIVYAVPNLKDAMDALEKKLGIRPIFGGYHLSQGTKNAVLNLGSNRYLEILAIDEANTNIQAPRWMGIDLIKSPQFTRWSIKSNTLEKDSRILKYYKKEMGVIHGGQRKMTNGKMLAWEMILPLSHPKVEIVPFMTDWQHSDIHPTDNLPAQCELLALKCTHPHPEQVGTTFTNLSLDLVIIQGEEASIQAWVRCPNGNVLI